MAGEDLQLRVEVLLVAEERQKEPVAVVHVVAGSEDIHDNRGEVVDFVSCDLGGFDSVEGNNVRLAEDSIGSCFNCCWLVFGSSQLLHSFVPSAVEGLAAESVAIGDVGPNVPEVFYDFDVVVEFWPSGVVEPGGCCSCASEVVAFAGSNPGPPLLVGKHG